MFLKATEEQRSTLVAILQKQPLFPSFFNKTLEEGAEDVFTHVFTTLTSHLFFGTASSLQKTLSPLGPIDSAATEQKKKKKSETAAISGESSLYSKGFM